VACVSHSEPRFEGFRDGFDEAGRPGIAQDGGVSEYQLLDAGAGRRLERFGAYVASRPAPAAAGTPVLDAAAWEAADLVFERPDPDAAGRWVRGAGLAPWTVDECGLSLELRPAAGGQLGLFPEHAAQWTWVQDAVDHANAGPAARSRLEVLSLFAYTGGATLVAARSGAGVVHLDSSRPAVTWARRNAVLSDLADRPVRWIVDDALAFVQREVRRGRGYDGLIIDPPSYGHGPRGAWRIDEHLPVLLEGLAALTRGRLQMILLTAHTPGYDGDRLASLVERAFGVPAEGLPLVLASAAGASLDAGAAARWHAGEPKR
jgi:23S rRNA (cytosine1962-C5)-methyltransferase